MTKSRGAVEGDSGTPGSLVISGLTHMPLRFIIVPLTHPYIPEQEGRRDVCGLGAGFN